jgi:hypothetical protein
MLLLLVFFLAPQSIVISKRHPQILAVVIQIELEEEGIAAGDVLARGIAHPILRLVLCVLGIEGDVRTLSTTSIQR